MGPVSGTIFIKYAQGQIIWKPNNIKVFVDKKTNGGKQDSQNRLRGPMSEEGEPCFLWICVN
jgi:hypothetical protein